MKQHQAKKLAFWFHMGVGIFTTGLLFAISSYIFIQAEHGSFDWWVYPAFAGYVAGVFTLDHVFFVKKLPEPLEKTKRQQVEPHSGQGFHTVSDSRFRQDEGRI